MDLVDIVKSINIVDFISQYVELEKRNGEYWGISPFTDPPEKTPSFSVKEDPPFFYDYSSGLSGNVYNFVKEYHKCTPKQAVEILEKYAGCEADTTKPREKLDATSVIKKYSVKQKPVKESSGVKLPEDFMIRYEKRHDKLKVWLDEGISMESLNRFQVYYDPYSDRLVYPIRNLDNAIVNIGGRALDPQWKEKGQRKYCYFYSWGTINTIYGIPENIESIRKKREVILFEGCKSVLLADTWGITNTGAILTSHLSENQMKILAVLGCDVVFALDKDIDIRNDKHIQTLKKYVNVYYIYDRKNLLDEKDAPVDKGMEVFKTLYDSRIKLR